MTEQAETWRWTRLKARAALQVAEDQLTNERIAAEAEVHVTTLERWKRHPDFQARVSEHIATFRARVEREGIGRLDRRVSALNDRWQRMQRVIEDRAEEHQDVPGGATGLLTRTVKGVGSGDDFELVELYAVDTALLKELREHERQAAQELGQWTEKREHSGHVGIGISFEDAVRQLREPVTTETTDDDAADCRGAEGL